MKSKKLISAALLTFLVSLLSADRAFATLDQAKLYQSALGKDKPKCQGCHVDKIPKKDDGKHEMNDYGKKLIAVKAQPDEATYKQVGPNPDAV